MIICYTVPDIWRVTDVIIFHFGLFFALLPLQQPKKWKFQKSEKNPGDIIILHKYAKNHDYMLYCSWDMAHNTCNCYFSFWAIFCTFTPLTAQKIDISKKKKKTPRDIIISHKCTKNHDNRLHCSWDVVCDRFNCYFSFWAIFCPFTPVVAQKIKISKKCREILFHT